MADQDEYDALALQVEGSAEIKLPDGQMLALGTDPSKVSLKAVADWSGHAAGAGTLSGGRAFVACFP